MNTGMEGWDNVPSNPQEVSNKKSINQEEAEEFSYKDMREVREAIHSLELQIEEEEKLQAKKNSEAAYGEQSFVVSLDGVEISAELIEKQKMKLQALKKQEETLRERQGMRRREGLKKLRGFFWVL